MIIHPDIDPVAIDLGLLQIHWYGLMYLAGFLLATGLLRYDIHRKVVDWKPDEVWDFLFYIALGVIIGGRLGYILFYNLDFYMQYPSQLLVIWSGGMSFHGGLLGVLTAVLYFSHKSERRFFACTDILAPLSCIGIGLGRIGNYINQELWGHPSDLPWATVFPLVDGIPRHPSQLYEALLEGLFLFLVLRLLATTKPPVGLLSGVFLMGYALSRFSVEFFRVPDQQLGYLAMQWMTMGQLLSLPMLLIGGLLIFLSRKNRYYG